MAGRERQRRRRRQERELQNTPAPPAERADTNGHSAVGRRQVRTLNLISAIIMGVVGTVAGGVYVAAQREIGRAREDAAQVRRDAAAEVARVRADAEAAIERAEASADEKVSYIRHLCGLD